MNATFKCSDCIQEYKHKRGLVRHRNNKHLNLKPTCNDCGKQFREKYDLKRHTCNTSLKRKVQKVEHEAHNSESPFKKQKLTDQELIEFEVSTLIPHFMLRFNKHSNITWHTQIDHHNNNTGIPINSFIRLTTPCTQGSQCISK